MVVLIRTSMSQYNESFHETNWILRNKEVARLIHDSNTFCFQDITAFFCFQRLLPPHYFLAIRSIHLRWAHAWDVKHFLDGVPPSNLEAWRSYWRQIAEMKGLESINVVIALGVPEYEEDFSSHWWMFQGL